MKNLAMVKVSRVAAFAGMLMLLPSFAVFAQTTPPPLLLNQLQNATLPNFAIDDTQMVTFNEGSVHGITTDDENWVEALVSYPSQPSSYTTGDFNGDGAQDIAVIVTANGGGSGTFYYLVIFTNNNGTPQYQTAQELGDRITLNSLTYTGGVFSVDMITQGPNDPMCCGTLRKIVQYKLVGDGSLAPVNTVPSTDGTGTNNDTSPAANTPSTTPDPGEFNYSGVDDNPTTSPATTDNSDDGWLYGLGVFIFLVILNGIRVSRGKNKNRARTNTNSGSSQQQQSSSTEQNQTSHRDYRKKDDPEMKALYRKVIRKYHPDYAQSESDKQFRTELTAKLNKAYQDGDMDTLKLFE